MGHKVAVAQGQRICVHPGRAIKINMLHECEQVDQFSVRWKPDSQMARNKKRAMEHQVHIAKAPHWKDRNAHSLSVLNAIAIDSRNHLTNGIRWCVWLVSKSRGR